MNDFYEIYFNYHKIRYEKNFDEKRILILGTPILNRKIEYHEIAEFIIKQGLSQNYIRKIDGEFCILLINGSNISIVSDRFCSIPIYYYNHNLKLYLSDNLYSLSKKIENLQFNNYKIFELFYFQKIHGIKTIFKGIEKLSSSSILNFKNGGLKISKYWNLNFEKKFGSLSSNAEILSDHLKESIKMKTSDLIPNEKFGIFLSGGMDTRTILSLCTEREINAVTLGFSESGEYNTAKQLTNTYKNIDHYFLKISQNYFTENINEILKLSSCKYIFDHALFYKLDKKPLGEKKKYLNGYGLDFMFQGMYIPKKVLKVFGKSTYISFLRKSNNDFTKDYIENISYKYKGLDPLFFVKKNHKIKIYDFLYHEIKKIENSSRKHGCINNADFYDYIITDDISSHYSFSNVISMNTSSDVRTVSFSNDLINLFSKIPLEQRLNARIMKKVLKNINPMYANIKSANHGMKITLNEYQMTLIAIFRKIARSFSNSNKFKHPSAQNRTWPDRLSYIMSNKQLNNKARQLLTSDHLDEALPFIDRDILNKQIKNCLENRNLNFGDNLYRLISIDQYLKL